MNARTVRETELITRTLARWGSLAAALIFGLTFLLDERRPWPLHHDQWVQIGLLAGVFGGYALAWVDRLELIGSVIVLALVMAAFIHGGIITSSPNDPAYLAVGIPALLHLAAVVMHQRGPSRITSDATR